MKGLDPGSRLPLLIKTWIILENEILSARFAEQLGPDHILNARLICC